MRILSALILYTIAPFVFGSPMWARAGIPWIDISDTSYSPGLSITNLAPLVCEFCWDEKSAISSDLVTDFKPRSDRLSSTVKLAVLVTSFIQFAPTYCNSKIGSLLYFNQLFLSTKTCFLEAKTSDRKRSLTWRRYSNSSGFIEV